MTHIYDIRRYQTQAAIELTEFVRSLGDSKIVTEDNLAYSEVSKGLFVEYRFEDNPNGGVKYLRFGDKSLKFYEFSRMKWFVENHKLVFNVSKEILSIFKKSFGSLPAYEHFTKNTSSEILSAIGFGDKNQYQITTRYSEFEGCLKFNMVGAGRDYKTNDISDINGLITKACMDSTKNLEYHKQVWLSWLRNEDAPKYPSDEDNDNEIGKNATET